MGLLHCTMPGALRMIVCLTAGTTIKLMLLYMGGIHFDPVGMLFISTPVQCGR